MLVLFVFARILYNYRLIYLIHSRENAAKPTLLILFISVLNTTLAMQHDVFLPFVGLLHLKLSFGLFASTSCCKQFTHIWILTSPYFCPMIPKNHDNLDWKKPFKRSPVSS